MGISLLGERGNEAFSDSAGKRNAGFHLGIFAKKIKQTVLHGVFMNTMFRKHPCVGASIPTGIQAVLDFLKLNLGNIILITLPDSKEEAIRVMNLCRKNRIYVLVTEIIRRGDGFQRWHCPSLSKADFREIFDAGGDCFLGRYSIGESGGLLYWPREYLLDPCADIPAPIPAGRNCREVHDHYISYLKKYLAHEREKIADGPFFDVESSIVFPYHVEAGIDALCLEMLPGDPLLTLASIRGTAESSGKLWGTHIAIQYYNGVNLDPLWMKRWYFSLYLSYLSGAGFIFPESGHYSYKHCNTKKYMFHDPEVREIRRILRGLVQFSRVHERPESGPEVPVGVIHGNYDGQPGIWNPYAWGQVDNGPEWESSDTENGWFLLRNLRRRRDCFRVDGFGEHDLSGNPSAGQFDVVPSWSEHFAKYRALFFVGYNFMTEELHSKLIDYVRQGGHLLLFLSHFDTAEKRGAPVKLFRDGDLSELCGVKIVGRKPKNVRGIQFFHPSRIPGWELPILKVKSDPIYLGRHEPAVVETADSAVQTLCGFAADKRSDFSLEYCEKNPILMERPLGKGFLWLVTDFEAPGAVGMRSFAENLIRIIMEGEKTEIGVLAPDPVRWAHYPAAKWEVLYLLNTDFDLSASIRIGRNGTFSKEILIPAAKMKVAYWFDSLLLVPEDNLCNAESYENGRIQISTLSQKMFLQNLSGSVLTGTVNDVSFRLNAEETTVIDCPEWLKELEKKHCFEPSFLDEPEIEILDTELPY